MKRPALSRNGWIDGFIIVGLILTAFVLAGDQSFILNPDGYGAVAVPLAWLASGVFALGAFVALRLTAKPGGDVWVLPAIVAPLAGLFGYGLVVGLVPTVSLWVAAKPVAVEAQVTSSGTILNSSTCSLTYKVKRTMVHVVRIGGQPPLLGQICVPSVRRRNGSGQLVLSPPPLPDPGPVVIRGEGNWFAVRVEGFATQ